MKRIEDIEKLTLEDLERLSDDESVAVPGSLGKGIDWMFVTALENRWPPSDGIMIQAV